MRIAVAAVFLAGCSLYFPSSANQAPSDAGADAGPVAPMPETVVLTKTRAFAGEHQVHGIEADGQGGLWVAYQDEPVAFGEPAEIRLVHLDAALTKVGEIVIGDERLGLSGIALSREGLWLNLGAVASFDCHVRLIDIGTGRTLRRFATQSLIMDIAVRGDTLLLSHAWNYVSALDVQTGEELWVHGVGSYGDSGQVGVAEVGDGTLWISRYGRSAIAHVAADFTEDRLGVSTAIAAFPNSGIGNFLTWDGDELIIVSNNQIIWLAPPP